MAIAAKMGNGIDTSDRLQKTYMPVNIATVREADEARRLGRNKLASGHNEFRELKFMAGKS